MADPTPISGLLGRAAEGMGVRDPVAVARVFSAWTQIVGPQVAAHCTPSGLKDGILKVSIESAAWAAQFKYLAPEVMRRLNAHLGAEVVTEIKPWVVTGSRAAKARGNRPDEPQPRAELPPLPEPSESEVEQARQVASSIPDPRLAESLKRALLAGKMHKKRG